MMERGEIPFAVGFEHWEIDYPERRPSIFDLSEILRHLNAQGTQSLIDDLLFIGTKEQNISGLRVELFQQSVNSSLGHEL